MTAVNPLLADLRKTRAHWYIFVYLMAKGLGYVPFFFPIAAIWEKNSDELFATVAQVVESAALTSAMLTVLLWRWKNKRHPSLTIAFAPLVLLWYLCGALSQSDHEGLLDAYTYTLNLIGSVAALIYIRHRKDEVLHLLHLLRWCLVGWISFATIEYMVWDFDFAPGAEWNIYRFVYWVAGAVTISATTIGISRLLITRDISTFKKLGRAGQMLMLEWLSIMAAIALAAYCNEVMLKLFYDDITSDAEQSVQVIRNHIAGFESQLGTLTQMIQNSGHLRDLFGEGEKRRYADHFLEDAVKGASNLACYVLDDKGDVIFSADHQAPDHRDADNYQNTDYFRDAQEHHRSDIGYEKQTPLSPPALFHSTAVMDPASGQLTGAVVFKKFLTAGEVFVSDHNAYLFDSEGRTMLSAEETRPILAFDELVRHPAAEFQRFSKTDPHNKLVILDGAYYVLSAQELDEEGSMIAVLYDAKPLLVICGILYVAIIWFIIFIICIFIFSRFVLARSDMELEQAQELRDILACTPNCVALLDKNLCFLRIDGSEVSALDRDAQELIGRPFINIWTKLDNFFVSEQLKRVFMGEKTTFEVIYKHPDGAPRNYSIFCGPLYNAEQKIEKIVTVWADITRKKKMEKELLERLQLEKTLSNITQEFLVSASAENALKGALHSLIVFCNADRACWFEFKPGQNYADCTLLDSLMTLDNASQDIFLQRMPFTGAMLDWKTQMEKRQAVTAEANPAQGEIYEFMSAQKIHHFVAAPIFLEGRPTGFIRLDYGRPPANGDIGEYSKPLKMVCATLQENLQRWKTQETLQLLNTAVQATTDGILISRMFPPPAEVVFANSAASLMSGLTREEIVGSQLTKIIGGSKNDPEMETKMLAALNAKSHYHMEAFQKRKDGQEYLAELEAAPIYDSMGNLLYSVITQKDITAKRDMETRSSLSSKLESIGQLAAGIAHEINTPAQFISDNLNFLKDNWEPLSRAISGCIKEKVIQENSHLDHILKEIPGAITDAIEGVKRISTIVQAMREFSHSSTEKTRADINSAISTTIVVGRNEWKYCAEIKTELAPDMPLVLCHIGDINQVILNLIVNSAHAIEEKYPTGEKGHITVRTLHTPTHAIIEVQDDGAGIPDKIRQKIFDPFFTTKPQGKGTGQGLYIAHRIIVDKHQGTIAVDSTPGQGTKFIIQLPLA